MTNTRTTSNLTYKFAARLVAAAVAEAESKGVNLSFVILDAGGHLVAAARMDGAAFITAEIARGKAFASVATGGQPGTALGQRFTDNPMVWGNVSALGFGAPLVPAQGAMPVFIDGVLAGAIGASGAPSQIDENVIVAAIRAVGGSESA